MPNRILKESIRTSRSINSLSDFDFRTWTYLVTYVDDYGRGSADPELLKGFVFPRRKNVTEGQIQKTITNLANAGLICLYEVDGELYFYFPNWDKHQRIQTKKSRFPDPPKNDTVSHGESRWNTVEHGGLPCGTETHGDPPPESESESEIESESQSEKEKRVRATDVVEDSELSEPVKDKLREWLEYKRERREAYKPMGLKSLVTQTVRAEQVHGASAVVDAFDRAMANGWKGANFDLIRGKPPDKKDDVLLRIIQEGA